MLPCEKVLDGSHNLIHWFANFDNYLASDVVPPDQLSYKRKKFIHDVEMFIWDDPYLYRSCVDGIKRLYVPEVEMLSILKAFHSSHVGRHHSGVQTLHKILHCGNFWPNIQQDTLFSQVFDRCQREGGV